MVMIIHCLTFVLAFLLSLYLTPLFRQAALKFGIMEAGDGQIGNPAEQLFLYCYHYDPATGSYGLAILKVMRIAAIFTILAIGGMLFVFWRYKKKVN